MFIILGVRSLANASRARQFNPLNPPGVGWGGYRFLKQIRQPWSVVRTRARSYAVVRTRSCVRGRSCVVVRGRAWSCAVGRAWSCVVGRARSCAVVRAWSVIRGRSCVVVRGRAVLPASRPARQPALPCCPLRGQHCRDTIEWRNERTTSNNPLNPPGVGLVKFFYPIKVRVSMGTCVPNLGATRRPVRKFCLSNL